MSEHTETEFEDKVVKATAPLAPTEPEGDGTPETKKVDIGQVQEETTKSKDLVSLNLGSVSTKGDTLFAGKVTKVDKRAGGAGTALLTFENGETVRKGISWVNAHGAAVGCYYLVTDTGAATCVSPLVFQSIFA